MSQGSHDGDVQGDQGIELPEITWVGDQRLMSGYCGRAETSASTSDSTTTTPAPAESRPVAVVRTKRSQGRVVRIGPPRAAEAVKSAA